MKKSPLIYFKKNTAELPEGYRKPIKRKRKAVAQTAPQTPQKPVIRRRTPRGRLMPLRMKNEFIPPGVDWCQINGQKVRQDIYFGDVRGRMFIPGRWTGEGCGPCGPSMFDFGGGCGDDGGCDSGCSGCDSGCADTGCAVDGCAGCASCADTGCETAGCETTGCAETGCTTTSDTGCETTGCAETGCTTTSDTGCTGCTTSSDSGCSVGCATGCSDTGCGMGCDMGCATGCDTGCGMGCAPSADSFSGCAVDYTGGGQGFGFGPDVGSNFGMGNAIGAPGWSTGDFGAYGIGGPTGTGFGPGAPGASIGGPGMYASAPGVTGFPGDFNAAPGMAFGMPNSQDVGPQTGPGLIGGPSTSQPGEALFGPGRESTPSVEPVNPDDRTEAPSSVFGPEFASNQAAPSAGFFGPSQAQAASRGSDELAVALQSSPFAQVQAMAEQVAQTNPQLAEALMGIVANQNTQTNMVGPMMTGFEQATPGAQQGFTGVGPTQSSQSAFTGQPSLSGVTGFANEQAQGKGDLFGPAVSQTNPNFDLVGPMTTQQGYDQLAAEMNAQQAPTAQAPTAQTETSPAQTVANAFNDLAGRGPGLTQTDFDSRFGQPDMFAPTYGPNVTAPTQQDPFDSRFGDFRSNQEQQQQLEQLSTNFGPNYGPQAPGLAEPGQLGRGFELADPNVTPGQTQFGQDPLGAQFSAPTASRGQQEAETLGPQLTDLLSNINPQTLNVGREAAPIGLWGMMDPAPSRGSPAGLPSQAGSRGFDPFSTPGRGPESGRGPGLSITVGANPQSQGRGAPGYYSTGGPGIAPGARGAEFGGVYGPGVATGKAGTNSFGVSGREGATGFYDAVTGIYYR